MDEERRQEQGEAMEERLSAEGIPIALLRYTFVGYQANFTSYMGCHCHPESEHHDAVFDIEKNLTRAQAVEKLARWNHEHPGREAYREAYILPTLIAEERAYVGGNDRVFGDNLAFDEALIGKAEEYWCDISEIEHFASKRRETLDAEAKAAAEETKRKAEETKKAHAEAARKQVEKKERELLDALKAKYEEVGRE